MKTEKARFYVGERQKEWTKKTLIECLNCVQGAR